MANADRKHFGAAGRSKGKGGAEGAMSELDDALLPPNAVLSNRDKAQTAETRGRDGRREQTEQYQDHAANRRLPDENRGNEDD